MQMRSSTTAEQLTLGLTTVVSENIPWPIQILECTITSTGLYVCV